MTNNDHILGYIPHFRTHPHVPPAIHWDVARGSPLRPDSDTFCTSLFLLAQGVTAHGAALANGKARVPAVFCESGYFVAVAIGATCFSANGVVGSRLDGLTTVLLILCRSFGKLTWMAACGPSNIQFRTATFTGPRRKKNRKIWLQ